MKKWVVIFMISAFLLTTGCSALDKVNETLNYVNEASDFVGEASKFSNELPTLINQAVKDPNARQELETSLNNMKTDIADFKQLTPPKVLADLHQQIEDQSKKVEEIIDVYSQNIVEGNIDPSLLESSKILETINEMSNILEAMEKLGQ